MLGILLSISLHAQNYHISFSATGQSSSVDAVKVENLTQCTTLDMSGADMLHLVATLGLKDDSYKNENPLKIYPNPFEKNCLIEFDAPIAGAATISISNINGKQLIQEQLICAKGRHVFNLKGLYKGVYTAQIAIGSYAFSSKLLSHSDAQDQPRIFYNDGVHTTQKNKILNESDTDYKGITSIIQMQYNTGDVLKLTGTSGIYKTVYMLVPTADQAVDFTFLTCTDADGQHYPVVKIGDQWWMAENLNVGTYVPIASPQVAGTKFCMDINGVADPSCPMGGLYEWNILMDGATPCNGTGAPPNDRCAVPVKGLCPDGWHLPSHYEWTTLSRNAGSSPASFPYDMSIGVLGTDEGGNLKTNCTNMWWSPNAGATNITGFSGIPGGDTWAGVFEDFGQSAYFWTSTWSYGYMPWVYALNYSIPQVGRSLYVPENGFSCRCVRD